MLDKLESLFEDNERIRVSREGNSITFEQDFTDNIAITADIFEREHMTFSHTVTLEGDCYKTVDFIKNNSFGPKRNVDNELTKFTFNSNSFKGDLRAKGFTYGVGKDNINGGILIQQPWDTEDIKKPVRDYLKSAGFKKIGSKGIDGKKFPIGGYIAIAAILINVVVWLAILFLILCT